MKRWWPSILAVIGASATVFSDPISQMISSHPKIATGLMFAYAVLTHLLPQPQKPTSP